MITTANEWPNRVRMYREKHGMTQSRLALAVGVSAATVSWWETGRSVPRGENLERLLALMNGNGDKVAKKEAQSIPPVEHLGIGEIKEVLAATLAPLVKTVQDDREAVALEALTGAVREIVAALRETRPEPTVAKNATAEPCSAGQIEALDKISRQIGKLVAGMDAAAQVDSKLRLMGQEIDGLERRIIALEARKK